MFETNRKWPITDDRICPLVHVCLLMHSKLLDVFLHSFFFFFSYFNKLKLGLTIPVCFISECLCGNNRGMKKKGKY